MYQILVDIACIFDIKLSSTVLVCIHEYMSTSIYIDTSVSIPPILWTCIFDIKLSSTVLVCIYEYMSTIIYIDTSVSIPPILCTMDAEPPNSHRFS